MKRTSLALIGVAALLVQRASAQLLFTTTNDFAGWSSIAYVGFGATNNAPTTGMDSDGTIINGLGNTTAAGSNGTGGAFSIQWVTGAYGYPTFSPGEQGNSNLIAALEQTGKILTFDYTTPTNMGGTYFTLGVVMNYGGTNWGAFDQLQNPSFTTSLGAGWTRSSFNWTTEAALLVTNQVTHGGTFTYFSMGLIWSSNYNPTNTPFFIDNIVLRNPPPPPISLFTTTNDFTGWTTESGFSNVGPTNFDLDGNVTNGVGNTSAPGALGTGGSLNIYWASNTFGVASYGPYEQTNAVFMALMLQASSLSFDYITPAVGSGTYFELGIVVNCQGRYDQLFPSATIAVSNGITRASIDWTAEAQALVAQQAANGGSFSNFQIGIIWNSDYTPPTTTPFQVDNITVTTNTPAPYVNDAGTALGSENCVPTNGVIDPGETVAVNLALQNTGNAAVPNIVATLLPTGGIVVPSGPQSYGTLAAGSGAVSNLFTFTASGICGGSIVATLQLETNSVFYRTVPYSFTLGTASVGATNTYTSGNISSVIPDKGTNTTSFSVADIGLVAHVAVKVRMADNYDGDVSMNLIHPDGTVVNLLAYTPAKAGTDFGTGATDCTGTFTVFDDSAGTNITSGLAPYAGSFHPQQPLGTLNGKSTQGTWKLQVIDTDPSSAGDTGTLYCAQLQIAPLTNICCSGGGPPPDPFTLWQEHYFTPLELGNPAYSGPNADPLGKGISNTNQFLAGFNPTNSAAYLRIISIAAASGNVNVTYLGASGDSTSGGPAYRTNVLEFTTGTANGSYSSNNFASTGVSQVLSNGTGLGTVSAMTDIGGATNKPSRYYRVRVLVP